MKKGKIVLVLLIGVLLLIGPASAQQGQEEGSKETKGTMEMKEGTVKGGMTRKEGMMMRGGGMMHHGEMTHGKMGAAMMGHCGCATMDVENRMKKHFEMCVRNAEKLGLSEEQMARLQTIHDEKRKKLIRLQAEIQVLHVDLKAEMDKPVPDMAKVEEILRKQETLRTDVALEAIGTRVEVSKVLTEEQFKKLRDMMKEMMPGQMGMGGM